MKKLFVLLIATAVAFGASAGVKVTKQLPKINVKEAKAMDRESKFAKKGDVNVMPGTALQAMDWNAKHSNHALKDGNTIVWDFEDEAQLNDWMTLDNDGDGFGWEYIYSEDGGNKTHSGLGCMASFSYDNPTYTALTPDNWLISPVVTLTGKLGFYYIGQDPSYASEVFAVYICVGDPTNINDFVKISDDITASGVMQAFEFDLSDYEGQAGCIAIRHYNVTDMFRLNIDDVTIGEFVPDEAPETPTVITEIPDGCQTYTYYRNSSTIYSSIFGVGATQTDGKFTVAFDSNGDVYMQNPAWYHDGYNSWVKGTYDWTTGIITIPCGQYLSWNDAYGYGVILAWGDTYVYEDGVDEETGEPLYYLGSELDDRTTEIQFMIDGDNIYLLGTQGDLNAEFPEWAEATGMYTYWSDDLSMTAIEFANLDEYGYAAPFGQIVNLVPAVPANPTADSWYDCGDESGYSRFGFTLPTTDVDGNPLDPEYMSYSIYVDNGNGPELFTFDYEHYSTDISQDMTEIPYYIYSGGWDFYTGAVYFYRTNEGDNPLFTENIGIQVFYTVNGVKNASEIAWLYDIDTNVAETLAGKTVANVRYFNVAGQEMAQPNGLTIMVTTYTDGTTNAVKVVK